MGGFFKEEFQFGFSLQDENQTLQHCNYISVSETLDENREFSFELNILFILCVSSLPLSLKLTDIWEIPFGIVE